MQVYTLKWEGPIGAPPWEARIDAFDDNEACDRVMGWVEDGHTNGHRVVLWRKDAGDRWVNVGTFTPVIESVMS